MVLTKNHGCEIHYCEIGEVYMLKGRLTALLANTRAAITGKGKMAAILANTKAAILADPSRARAVFRVRVDSIDGVRSTVTAQSPNPPSFDEPAAPNLGLGCSRK